MELSRYEKKMIWDYIFFHYHSPLNTHPDDYRKFNAIMFRGIKLNALYSIGSGALIYHFLIGRDNGVLKGLSTKGYILTGVFLYGFSQFYIRMKQIVFSDESLECALNYKADVQRYNDHYRRIYGNS
jgi:hypothetical protein